jgi:hypothetical protein
MSMSMPTLSVCTLSNIRVASNTHCFVAANRSGELFDCKHPDYRTVYAERAFRLARQPGALNLLEAAVRDRQPGGRDATDGSCIRVRKHYSGVIADAWAGTRPIAVQRRPKLADTNQAFTIVPFGGNLHIWHGRPETD